MPEIPNVLPGGETESDWANLIRDRVLQRYPTKSARDASVTSPQIGELSFIQATNEVQIWTGSEWNAIARVNYESLLVYGDSQGYWLRTDPNDNTKDFRIVSTGAGTLLVQSRASGSFSTVAGFNNGASYRPYGIVQGSDRPVSSLTLSAPAGTTDPVQTMNVPFGGWWKFTQAGFIEGSTTIDGFWQMFIRTKPGGSILSESSLSHRGSVVGSSVRGSLSASVIHDLSTGTDVELLVSRSQTGGTQLLRRFQMFAEWLGPKP